MYFVKSEPHKLPCKKVMSISVLKLEQLLANPSVSLRSF